MQCFSTLQGDHDLLTFFESVMKGRQKADSKVVANILINDLMAILNENELTYAEWLVLAIITAYRY